MVIKLNRLKKLKLIKVLQLNIRINICWIILINKSYEIREWNIKLIN